MGVTWSAAADNRHLPRRRVEVYPPDRNTPRLAPTEASRDVQVRLYRDGDAHFAGVVYAVSATRHRTLGALLDALNDHGVVRDRSALPRGVRHLYDADSGRRVTAVDRLKDGASYVCSSFRPTTCRRRPGCTTPTPPRVRRVPPRPPPPSRPAPSHRQPDPHATIPVNVDQLG